MKMLSIVALIFHFNAGTNSFFSGLVILNSDTGALATSTYMEVTLDVCVLASWEVFALEVKPYMWCFTD